jgi:hypothetical protein
MTVEPDDGQAAMEQHVAVARAAVKVREQQLGRPITRPELKWLLQGLFNHRCGKVLGDEVAGAVFDRLTAEDGTGVRRRGR